MLQSGSLYSAINGLLFDGFQKGLVGKFKYLKVAAGCAVCMTSRTCFGCDCVVVALVMAMV